MVCGRFAVPEIMNEDYRLGIGEEQQSQRTGDAKAAVYQGRIVVQHALPADFGEVSVSDGQCIRVRLEPPPVPRSLNHLARLAVDDVGGDTRKGEPTAILETPHHR